MHLNLIFIDKKIYSYIFVVSSRKIPYILKLNKNHNYIFINFKYLFLKVSNNYFYDPYFPLVKYFYQLYILDIFS